MGRSHAEGRPSNGTFVHGEADADRLDGTGYFRGLDPERLAIEARIVAVADVYEAPTAELSYREAMPPEAALAVMAKMSGDHLAADIVGTLPDII